MNGSDRPGRGAAPATTARLGGLLGALGPWNSPATPREVAELLWLASRLPGGNVRPEPPAASAPAIPDRAAGPTAPAAGSDPRGAALPAPTGNRLYLPPPATTTADPAAGERVTPLRITGGAALPDTRGLARALRPFKRRVPSATATVVDEERTVHRVAEYGQWSPVVRPAEERWLDVALVLDEISAGTPFWEPLAIELQRLFRQLGAFRAVALYRLRRGADGRPVLVASARPGSALLRPTTVSGVPGGRTVTLVLTDAVAPEWRTTVLLNLLRTWATIGPTAIVQMLPEHLWQRTALMPLRGCFRSTETAGPTARMLWTPHGSSARRAVRRSEAPPIALPVLEAAPEWLAPWARAVAGSAVFDGAAVLLPAPSAELPPPARTPGIEGLAAFRATAAPDVQRLAAYLAAVPLNPPVMRLVQAAMLPESPPSALAEIVFSGLLRRVPGGDPADPLGHVYTFAPGVRDVLRGTLRHDEADEIAAAVTAYRERRTPAGPRFTAAVTDPDGADILPPEVGHWAEASPRQNRIEAHERIREETEPHGAVGGTTEGPAATGQVALRPEDPVQETDIPENPAPGNVQTTGPATVAGRRFLITVRVSHDADESRHRTPGVPADFLVLADAFGLFGYEHVLTDLADDPRPLDVWNRLIDWQREVELGPSDNVTLYYRGHMDRGLPGGTLGVSQVLQDLEPEPWHTPFGAIGPRLLVLLDVCSTTDSAAPDLARELGWWGDATTILACITSEPRNHLRESVFATLLGGVLTERAQQLTTEPILFSEVVEQIREISRFQYPRSGDRYVDLTPHQSAFSLVPVTTASKQRASLQASLQLTLEHAVAWLSDQANAGKTLFIVGGPGKGKSTLAGRLPEQAGMPVVLVRARNLAGAGGTIPDLPSVLPNPAAPFAVVLDGLDEYLGEPSYLVALLWDELASFPLARLVITSRPLRDPRPELADDVIELDPDADSRALDHPSLHRPGLGLDPAGGLTAFVDRAADGETDRMAQVARAVLTAHGQESSAPGASARDETQPLVRPYAMTGGRTRPRYHLPIEALIHTTADPNAFRGLLPEHQRLCVLCHEIKSVAEVSALLEIPLGVARILAADLAEAGMVTIHEPNAGRPGGQPEAKLLERVLSALRGL